MPDVDKELFEKRPLVVELCDWYNLRWVSTSLWTPKGKTTCNDKEHEWLKMEEEEEILVAS